MGAHNRKWTPEAIENLRQRRAAGERLVDIAADIGVSPARVHELTGRMSPRKSSKVHPARAAWLLMREDFIAWTRSI